jgi:ADP-ribose pyrophosphatase
MKDQIEFPCGMIENGEEPLVAAKRELQEETGIELLNDSQIKYLGKYAANPAFMNNFMHYYYVNLDYAEFCQGETNFDEHEKIEKIWMNKEEFMDKVHNCDSDCASVFMALAVNMLENEYMNSMPS